MVLGLCERFGCLPSQLYREPVELLRLVKYESYGRVEEVSPDGDG